MDLGPPRPKLERQDDIGEEELVDDYDLFSMTSAEEGKTSSKVSTSNSKKSDLNEKMAKEEGKSDNVAQVNKQIYKSDDKDKMVLPTTNSSGVVSQEQENHIKEDQNSSADNFKENIDECMQQRDDDQPEKTPKAKLNKESKSKKKPHKKAKEFYHVEAPIEIDKRARAAQKSVDDDGPTQSEKIRKGLKIIDISPDVKVEKKSNIVELDINFDDDLLSGMDQVTEDVPPVFTRYDSDKDEQIPDEIQNVEPKHHQEPEEEKKEKKEKYCDIITDESYASVYFG